MINNNFEFFLDKDLSKYSGQWIAISGNHIIAAGNDGKIVVETATALCEGKERPLFARIPKENQTLIL